MWKRESKKSYRVLTGARGIWAGNLDGKWTVYGDYIGWRKEDGELVEGSGSFQFSCHKETVASNVQRDALSSCTLPFLSHPT